MITVTSKIFPFLTAATLLFAGCQQSPEQEAKADDPKVAGLVVQFDPQAPAVKRLQTAAVDVAHSTELSFPARLVWDEDHTARLMPPVSGHLVDVVRSGVLGAAVQRDEILAHILSPEVGVAQAESASADAALVQTELNYRRVSELVNEHGASDKELEQAKADWEHAKAEAARTQLRLKVLGINSKGVDQQLAVRSPLNGVIVERNTNPGMEWRPDLAGGPLFTITDPAYLWCQIDVPEKEIDKLHTNLKVTLHANAWPQEVFEAVIDNIGDSVDGTSRTVKVRAHLRNENRHLKNEMYVTANLVTDAMGTLDVPAKAVFLNNSEQQVFVKTGNGTYTRKSIAPVASNAQWVSIARGLDQGDEVVVDGALYLEKILETAAVQPAASQQQ